MFNRRNLIIAGSVAIVLIIAIVSISAFNRKPITQEATASNSVDRTADDLYAQAAAFESDGELAEAKNIYQTIYNEYPDFEQIEDVQTQLEELNLKLIFSSSPSNDATIHEVVSGDTLGKLAKQYGTTIDLIKINNNLDSDVIRLGKKLRIWTSDFNIFVDKSQNKLFLKKQDEVLKVYNVSTGEGNSTPVGEFKVTTRLKDPVWFNKGVVVPPESPANVLGSRWLGFDIPGYGIHGTIEPETIGQQVTAGCVRMRNPEVEELYNMIPIGTNVVVVD